jgi:ATP-dependent DNA ligase
VALKPELIAEVGYDQVTGRRFRHGTGFLRWRPDKRPDQCRLDQLEPELRPAELFDLLATAEA